MSMGTLEVTRLSGSLGAEVRGFRMTEVDDAVAGRLRALLTEHRVLFFPDQHPTPDHHIAFGRWFGELQSHPNLEFASERPEFFELRAEGGRGAIADEWHSDLSFAAQPSVLAILHMKKCPDVGGDTMWANTAKAYAELSPPLRDLCDGLTALHDASPHYRPEQMSIHPVVRVHPETGERSLFVNEHFTRRIVELSQEESDLLLGHLTRWVSRPNFTVRYRWSEGTVAMWDNRATQHYVLNDFEGERIIQRVTVMGDQPRAACPPRWEPFRGTGMGSSWRDRQLRELRKAEPGAFERATRPMPE